MFQTPLLMVSGSSCGWLKAGWAGRREEHSACAIDQPSSAQLWKNCISHRGTLTKVVQKLWYFDVLPTENK